MDPQLPKIEPKLEFMCELYKESTCPLQLLNESDQVLAFKVKTTSPKVYYVRPKTGIVQPMSTCDITITRHAQKVAPPEIQCKDKFLIQSMIVPFGTTNEDITSSMFKKDIGMHIEEKKLKVLISTHEPRYAPVLLTINGNPKKKPPTSEASFLKDQVSSGLNLPQSFTVANNIKDSKLPKDVLESKLAKDKQDSKVAKDVEEVIDVEKLQLTKDIEKLKSSLNTMELRLDELEDIIKSLREEKCAIIEENNTLKQELVNQQRKKWRTGMRNGVFSFFGFSGTCSMGKYVPLLKSG